MTGIFVPATRQHAIDMAPRMRQAEVAEIWASHRLAPLDCLLDELEHSLLAMAWIVDGEVAFMFGLVLPQLLGLTVHPWLLTTPLVEKHPHAFARACRRGVASVLRQYPQINGMVDARYEVSIRWLEWLGFDVGTPVAHGREGLPFRPFHMGTRHVAA